MGLRGYVAKRIVYSFVLLFFVMSLNFIIFMVMPGDPASLFINPKSREDPARVAEQMRRLKELWGIGDPTPIRYAKYLFNMLTWNFGVTFEERNPVANEMLLRLPYTLMLMGGSITFAVILGVLLGVLSAHKRG